MIPCLPPSFLLFNSIFSLVCSSSTPLNSGCSLQAHCKHWGIRNASCEGETPQVTSLIAPMAVAHSPRQTFVVSLGLTFSHSVTPQINWNEWGLLSLTFYKYFLLSITVSVEHTDSWVELRWLHPQRPSTIDHRLQMSANSTINLSYGRLHLEHFAV